MMKGKVRSTLIRSNLELTLANVGATTRGSLFSDFSAIIIITFADKKVHFLYNEYIHRFHSYESVKYDHMYAFYQLCR